MLFAIIFAFMPVVASEVDVSVSAQIVVNKESPTETDVIVIFINQTQSEVSLSLENDDADQFEMLHITAETIDGIPIAETDMAKAFKARIVRDGSSRTQPISPGEKYEMVLPLSQFFDLPAHRGYSVAGFAGDVIYVNGILKPIQFKATKARKIGDTQP